MSHPISKLADAIAQQQPAVLVTVWKMPGGCGKSAKNW